MIKAVIFDMYETLITHRQAAENLVNIGRFTIDGIIHGRRDNLFEPCPKTSAGKSGW